MPGFEPALTGFKYLICEMGEGSFRSGSHERCVGALGSSCMLILPSNRVPPGPQVMAALALHGMSGCIYDFVL